jgi:hypothetical protein
VRALTAPLILVAARARRRPAHLLLPALGVALAVAFAGGVAAEAVIAGDQSARAVLSGLAPADRTVRITWQGVVTPDVARQARNALRNVGIRTTTDVALLNPVRLSGIVVRPAAIAPLGRWLGARAPGPCGADDCPMLMAGAPPGLAAGRVLSAPGIRIHIAGSVRLTSAVPLGFSVTTGSAPPVLLTDDVAGLEAFPGLAGIFRMHEWVSALDANRLHSWDLQGLEQRLGRTQADLTASSNQFEMTAPFDGLDQARAQARAAPHRLLLVGGGALAALALFIVLAGGGLRDDQRRELERLRVAGAKTSHIVVFALGESALLGGLALVAGAALAILAATVLAGVSGVPAGALLTHSLITPAGTISLIGAWLATSALLTTALLTPSGRVADALALVAVAALAVALALGSGETTGAGSTDALPVMLAPLCCLAVGVITYRGATALLRAGERMARRGPVTLRLAFVGLARAPGLPSLAIAFVAVSIGLAGFALAYRATLLRGTSDQAADRVPLDATISPGPDFRTPLTVAPLSHWTRLATGAVLPVRRTEATYPSGGGSVTIPALGIPASGIPLIHGWRVTDGSAPLHTLAARLAPKGAVRTPGPRLPKGTRTLSLAASSSTFPVTVTADLLDSTGAITQVPIGQADAPTTTLRAAVPPGSWELEALELDEPTGLDITNAHQNGENPSGTAELTTTLMLGRLTANAGRPIPVPLSGWRGVGAAAAPQASEVRFAASGSPGILRPPQPSDVRPLPVLVDPATAAAAARGGRLGLNVDGLPVGARVVGVLRRFPTIPSEASGFVVADEATMAAALDAQLPGQGRSDELWIATRDLGRIRTAVALPRLAELSTTFREDVERGLRSAPISRGVLGTLAAAAILSAALALLGLLVALVGAGRDGLVERDLEAQGVGRRGLRAELRTRFLLAGVVGLVIGLVAAALLTRLAVAGVRAAATGAVPQPPLVTVVPWAEIAVLAVAVVAVLAVAARAVR